jgi:hypothetical protein
MEKAAADRLEEQIRSAFPEGAIARVKVLQYGDDPEVEPGQAAARVFFDWPGRLESKKAGPQTVHAFCVANSAALDKLGGDLPRFIEWVEFRPDDPPGAATPGGLSYRIERHRKRAAPPQEAPEELTPVMARLGSDDLAIVDTLIAAGIANSCGEALRWALGRVREHPAYAQLQQRVYEIDELKAQF